MRGTSSDRQPLRDFVGDGPGDLHTCHAGCPCHDCPACDGEGKTRNPDTGEVAIVCGECRGSGLKADWLTPDPNLTRAEAEALIHGVDFTRMDEYDPAVTGAEKLRRVLDYGE